MQKRQSFQAYCEPAWGDISVLSATPQQLESSQTFWKLLCEIITSFKAFMFAHWGELWNFYVKVWFFRWSSEFHVEVFCWCLYMFSRMTFPTVIHVLHKIYNNAFIKKRSDKTTLKSESSYWTPNHFTEPHEKKYSKVITRKLNLVTCLFMRSDSGYWITISIEQPSSN